MKQSRESRRYLPAPLEWPRTRRGWLPDGREGTRRTLELIADLVRQGARDFYVRQAAIDILLQAAVPAKAYVEEIEALFRWVQRNIRYTKDPFRLELLTGARRILQLRIGDCDDMTVLLGAMLESIGHSVRLVVAGYRPDYPHLFSHVYLEVEHQGHRIALDATMPYPMGWEAPWAVRATMPVHDYGILAPTLRGATHHVKVGEVTGILYNAPGHDGRMCKHVRYLNQPAILAAPPHGGTLEVLGCLRVNPNRHSGVRTYL